MGGVWLVLLSLVHPAHSFSQVESSHVLTAPVINITSRSSASNLQPLSNRSSSNRSLSPELLENITGLQSHIQSKEKGPYYTDGEYILGCLKDAAWYCMACCCKYGNPAFKDYVIDKTPMQEPSHFSSAPSRADIVSWNPTSYNDESDQKERYFMKAVTAMRKIPHNEQQYSDFDAKDDDCSVCATQFSCEETMCVGDSDITHLHNCCDFGEHLLPDGTEMKCDYNG